MTAPGIDATTVALIEQARRLGLTWTLTPATVSTDSSDVMNVQVLIDGSPLNATRAISLIGQLVTGMRVMVASVPPQGNYIIGFYGSGGQWTEWTPTFTNLTVGDGTVQAWYRLQGAALDFHLLFELGATSAVGTGPTFTVPYPLHADYFPTVGTPKAGHGSAGDAGIAEYDLSVRVTAAATPSTLAWVVIGVNGLHAPVAAALPFAFGTGDTLAAFGRVHIA